MSRTVLALAVVFLLSVGLRAEEAGLTDVRSDLDGVEKDLGGLKAGDVAGASALVDRINKAITKLNQCREKTAPEWKEQGRRAKDLDGKARSVAAGKSSDPAAAAAPDEITVKAKDDLDAIEKDLSQLAGGDADGANALVLRINAVRDLLGKSSREKRNVPLWKDCAARCAALDKKVRARNDDGTPSAEFPEASTLARDDRYIFTSQFEPVFADYAAQLKTADSRTLASDWRAKRFSDAITRMRTALGKIRDQENGAVKKATTRVAELETSWKAKVEEGKKLLEKDAADATTAAQDVDTRLAEIERFFDPRTFTCGLESPFTTARVRSWVERLREVQRLQKKGREMLAAIVKDHPEHEKNPRLKRLENVFATELERKLQLDIEQVAGTSTGRPGLMQGAIDAAKPLLQADALKPERLANDEWATEWAARARNAADAAEAFAWFSKEWLAKEDAGMPKLAAEYRGVADKIEQGAVQATASARMPEARSTDESLIATAKETLADPKIGAGEIRRMLVNASLASHEERKSEARDEGDLIRIWTWTEVWDDYQVCCAERVGSDWRLVFYRMKYVLRGPKWMTLGKWYVSDRIVGRRILEENIGK